MCLQSMQRSLPALSHQSAVRFETNDLFEDLLAEHDER